MVKPFWVFGIDIEVQNAVGTGAYGIYFAIFNFSFLFNIVLDMGINNFNNRNIAQNNKMIVKHFPRLIVLKVMLGVLYFIVAMLTALFIGYDSLRFKFLIIIAFNQFLLSFLLYLRSNVSGLLLFRTDSLLSVLDRLLMIFFVGMLLWVDFGQGDFKIIWFVWAQTFAYLISVLIAFLVVAKHARFRLPKWDYPFFILIFKKSAPFALLILLMTIYGRVDSVLLDRLLPEGVGNREAGIYAHGYRLLDAANQLAFLFAVLLLPAFAYLIKKKESIHDLTRITFNILFVVSSTLAITSIFFSHEIVGSLYPKKLLESGVEFKHRYEEAVRIFPMLMLAFMGYASTYVFGTLLTAKGDLKNLNRIAFFGMLISVIMNLILIPKLYAVGSAYANFTAQWTTALLQIYLAHRYFKFTINWKYISSLFIFILGVIFIFYTSMELQLLWYWKMVISVMAAAFLSMVLRIVNVKEFYQILLNRNE